jgi:hypothetical protein
MGTLGKFNRADVRTAYGPNVDLDGSLVSVNSEQEYFADGIVEEIITALSRFRQLFVPKQVMSPTADDELLAHRRGKLNHSRL